MNRARTTGLALLAALAAPAPASAEVLTLGSSLSAPADVSEAHPVDTAYWHNTIPGGPAVGMPSDGQVSSITVRGFAVSNTPAGASGGGERQVRVQTLAPDSGTYRVRLTSGPFNLPGRSGGTPDTRTTFRPENLCAKDGDRVALNSIGGFGSAFPEGTPLQIFANRPGAVTSRYTEGGGTNNGDRFTGGERVDRPDTELLMRIVLKTGEDASGPCRGSTPAPTPTPDPGGSDGGSDGSSRAPARVPSGARLSVSRRGAAALSVFCSRKKDCRGRLSLTASGTTLGRARYAIGRSRTKTVRLRLTEAGLRLVKRRRYSLRVRATLITEPGGAGNTSSRAVRVKRRGA